MSEDDPVHKESRLSRADAVRFNATVIGQWNKASEVWPFAYGDDIASMMSSASSFYITYFFRRQLKMRAYARLSCYTPVMGLAALGSYIFHSQAMTADILNAEACPLCLSTKAALTQVAIGVGYPLIIAPVVTFYLADKLLTYPVPSLTKAPKEVFRLWFKLVQKNPRPFFVLTALHAVGSIFITYQKEKTLIQFQGSAVR